jgi:hypothetical protein
MPTINFLYSERKSVFKMPATVTGLVFEKIAQNVARSVFCQNYYIPFSAKKLAQKLGKILYYLSICPK